MLVLTLERGRKELVLHTADGPVVVSIAPDKSGSVPRVRVVLDLPDSVEAKLRPVEGLAEADEKV